MFCYSGVLLYLKSFPLGFLSRHAFLTSLNEVVAEYRGLLAEAKHELGVGDTSLNWIDCVLELLVVEKHNGMIELLASLPHANKIVAQQQLADFKTKCYRETDELVDSIQQGLDYWLLRREFYLFETLPLSTRPRGDKFVEALLAYIDTQNMILAFVGILDMLGHRFESVQDALSCPKDRKKRNE